MRHGWTVVRTLIILGTGLCGFSPRVQGGELTDDRLGIRTVPILLLTRSDVQRALNLEPKQGAECRRAAFALYDRAAVLRGRKDAGAQAARGVIDREMSSWLDTHLTPEQLGRLEQIDLQWEGASAMLSRPFVHESLNLTPAQRKTIEDCIAAGRAQRARDGWSYENHVNQTRQAIAVLDARQRELWIQLLGPHCPFKIAVERRTTLSQPTAAAVR